MNRDELEGGWWGVGKLAKGRKSECSTGICLVSLLGMRPASEERPQQRSATKLGMTLGGGGARLGAMER